MSDTRAIFNDIVESIVPHAATVDDRQALYHLALVEYPYLLSNIQWEGKPRAFAARTAAFLLDYEVAPSQPALALVLEQLKAQVGSPTRENIDRLLTALPGILATRHQTHKRLNRDAANRPTTAATVTPLPERSRLARFADFGRLALRALGVLFGLFALGAGVLWILSPQQGTFEPLIVVFSLLGGGLFTAGSTERTLDIEHPNDAPTALRIAVGVLGALITAAGLYVASLWMANPDGGYEPLTVVTFLVGPTLLGMGNRRDLGIGWLTWRGLDDDNKVRFFLNELEAGWIEGFLRTALRDVRDFSPDDAEGYDIRWSGTRDLTVNTDAYGDIELRDAANVVNVFDALAGRLLILGEPGAGKSILLLQLAEALMDRTRAQLARTPDERRDFAIPVVFNLSDWARTPEPTPLADWIVSEGQRSYNLGRGWMSRWRDGQALTLLLDGLDEIREDWRDAYVGALNDFQREHSGVRVVVSSRIKEFEALNARLNVNGALKLAELDAATVERLLAADELAGLRALAQADPTVREMTSTPFLLNTMIYTYREQSAESLKLPKGQTGAAARRQHLFERYVNLRLRASHQQPSGKAYSVKQAERYLKFLATKMVGNNITAPPVGH